ncbi:uncharacterized protein LOC123209666 isoform X2 [Mangifera indica]|uniref:uncharacterized protein LOC123209666 isoform X2 n=1 Tax=Mangifera indica TaxID=29780 RepID=UPI001CFB2613|nr:uncharacterized protein LOC123209666 isoform X2 [Mangifera indica]
MFSPLHKTLKFAMNIYCFQRNFSAALPPVQLPSQRETHLWYIVPDEVKSTSLLNHYLELLSPREKENIYRLRGDQHKKTALLARALVRTTIARYQTHCQVSPRDLKFRKNIYGKPEIGIDVEEKQRRTKSNILAFAKRYFSLEEVKFLTAMSDPEIQRQEFIKLWTLKEAYVKALGRGFSAAPFKTFTLGSRTATIGGFHLSKTLDSEASEIILESSDNPETLTSNWQFALLDLDCSHYAAICVEEDKSSEVKMSVPMKLRVWKTIPFVEDELVSGTHAVVVISGLINQL